MGKKFDQDVKDRVVRLVEDRIKNQRCSIDRACREVAPKLGVSHHSARTWVKIARRAGITYEEVDLVAKNAQLRQENQELRDINKLLRAASAFFALELDRPRRK